MRRWVRWTLWGSVVLLAAAALAVHLAKDRVVHGFARRMLAEATGFDVDLAAARVGLWPPSVELTGLRLDNPEGYRRPEALNVRRLYAETSWGNLLRRRNQLDRLELDVPDVVMVREPAGRSNLEELARSAEAWQAERDRPRASPPSPPRPDHPAAAPAGPDAGRLPSSAALPPAAAETTAGRLPPRIEELVITLGSVRIVDYTFDEDDPVDLTYRLDAERRYQGVTNFNAVAEDLTGLVAARVLPRALRRLEEQAPELMEGVTELIRQWGDGESTGEAVERLKGSLRDLFR